MKEDIAGNNTEDVADLDQRALAICTECLVELLCVLDGLGDDFEGLKLWNELTKGVDAAHGVEGLEEGIVAVYFEVLIHKQVADTLEFFVQPVGIV